MLPLLLGGNGRFLSAIGGLGGFLSTTPTTKQEPTPIPELAPELTNGGSWWPLLLAGGVVVVGVGLF